MILFRLMRLRNCIDQIDFEPFGYIQTIHEETIDQFSPFPAFPGVQKTKRILRH